MSATDFFDTNVLIYLVSNDAAKAARSATLLAGGGTVSIQVLDEFASVALRKIGRSMSDIRLALSRIRTVCAIAPTDIATHELGLDIAERHKYSVYDSMLLAAAQKTGCTMFYSEDLKHGQKIGGLTIRDPFRP